MKNITKKLNIGFFLIAMVGLLVSPLAFGAKTASAGPISITCNSAVIEGDVVTGGTSTQVWFEWGPNGSLSNSTAHQTFSSNAVFRATISGLNQSSSYSYRAMAQQNGNTATGQTFSFNTPPCTTQGLPTVNLTANPTSINYGGSSTLSWNSTNATSCTSYWTGSTATSGSGVVTPGATTTYSITCSNSVGSATDTATVNVGSVTSRPTVNISADDASVTSGDSTIVRWNSNNADTCVASGGTNGWSGTRSLSGTFYTGSLTSARTYTITCTNDSGSATDSVTVRVSNSGGNINVDISADDTSLDYGDSTIIRWDSDNADDCRASSGTNGWSGDRNTSGTFRTGSLTSDTTYRIRCTNNDGDSDSDLVTVSVNGNNNSICRDSSATNYLGTAPCRYNQTTRPTVSIYADNTSVNYNGATTVRWSSSNATSCYASGGSAGWAGAKSIGPASFYTGSLTGTRTYTINCSNDSGSASDFVTVNVRGRVLGVTSTASSYLLVTSSVDRNRPIVPTLDNTNPCPGDDMNYSITYKNVGNASLTNLVLRVDLPQEVDYIASTPSNPTQSGQTLIFTLGTLRANGEGTVKIQVRLRNDVAPGTNLNFPATLSYTDATGAPQSVSANVNASVCQPTFTGNTNENNGTMSLGAAVFGAGFLPTSILGWLFLLILILILVLLAKYLFGQSFNQKKTVVMVDQFGNERTTTTSTHQ